MKRLDNETKIKIEKFAKAGFSLNKISRKLNLQRSVTYYWFRKFSSHKMPKIVINNSLREEIGEIVGAFCGDGNYYINKNYGHQVQIYLAENEEWYAHHLDNCFKKVFSKSAWIWHNRTDHLFLFRIFGIDIINFIKTFVDWKINKTYSVSLKKSINNFDEEFLIGFLRGLYLTDGWLDKTTNTANFASTSPRLMKNFADILNLFSINYHRYHYQKEDRKMLYKLNIPRNNAQKFFEVIKIKEVLPRGISGKTF